MKSQFFWPSSADTEQELFDTGSRNEEESSDDTTAAENDDSEVDTSVEREDPSRDTADTFVTIWWTHQSTHNVWNVINNTAVFNSIS